MGYRIKTVSELTGISRATLLAWERRYGVVSPDRQDNGYREYSDEDVACLQSIRRLKDQGYKVSEAIAIIEEARAAARSPAPTPGVGRPGWGRCGTGCGSRRCPRRASRCCASGSGCCWCWTS